MSARLDLIAGATLVRVPAGRSTREVLDVWATGASAAQTPVVVLCLDPVELAEPADLVGALTAALDDPGVLAAEPVMLVAGSSPRRPRRPAGRVLAARRGDALVCLATMLAEGPADDEDPAMLLAAALLARGGSGARVALADLAVGTTPGQWRTPDAETTGPLTRWTIRTAVPFDDGRESWGDLHFARALAAALGRAGVQATVEYRSDRFRAAAPGDGVVLVLRGRTRLDPVPAPGTDPVRLLWVISHPDEVTDAELAAYDQVLAAGDPWAGATSSRTGVAVETLLQATGFPDVGAAVGEVPHHEVLFVANARGVRRPMLDTARAAGAEVAVYGKGWEQVAPELPVVADRLPQALVPAAYAAADVVLNDHWADMRECGFVSNRLFDAVACGARVLSDDLPGVDLDALFEGCVRAVAPDDVEAVRRLLADVAESWPDDEHRRRVAQRVRREHGFDARAGQLTALAARVAARRVP